MDLNNLSLVLPSIEHEEIWKNIINEFKLSNEKIIPYALKLDCEDYDVFLQKTFDFHNNINVPHYLVPASTYFLINDNLNKIVGAVNIRHRLNDVLLKSGGHIGYGVSPTERKKGYATKMLELALLKCKDIGIEKALVTCNKENIGSAKTIIKNGGIFENEVTEDNGNIVQRYWINIH